MTSCVTDGSGDLLGRPASQTRSDTCVGSVGSSRQYGRHLRGRGRTECFGRDDGGMCHGVRVTGYACSTSGWVCLRTCPAAGRCRSRSACPSEPAALGQPDPAAPSGQSTKPAEPEVGDCAEEPSVLRRRGRQGLEQARVTYETHVATCSRCPQPGSGYASGKLLRHTYNNLLGAAVRSRATSSDDSGTPS
ncbi:hypothetical protein GCM10010207_79620 [Streptomyces atratus]|nr:hypothetical protein GCM10010207_79620 [Streptomyces atratus]